MQLLLPLRPGVLLVVVWTPHTEHAETASSKPMIIATFSETPIAAGVQLKLQLQKKGYIQLTCVHRVFCNDSWKNTPSRETRRATEHIKAALSHQTAIVSMHRQDLLLQKHAPAHLQISQLPPHRHHMNAGQLQLCVALQKSLLDALGQTGIVHTHIQVLW